MFRRYNKLEINLYIMHDYWSVIVDQILLKFA